MKDRIDIFVELGSRLSKGLPADITETACAENGWFRKGDIDMAIEAITSQMLDRTKLEGWMERYPALPTRDGSDVLIIMAGNIPMVGFFDLLCVAMAGHKVYVKCSSKDRALIEYIISVLKEIEPTIPMYISKPPAPKMVIATGGDNAVRFFKSKYGSVKTLLRGSRHSIAVVGKDDDIKKLATDVYSYSGLGCRNVSMIFVPKGYLLSIPCVETHSQYHSNYLQNKALQTMLGTEFKDNGSSLLIKSKSFPSSLSSISVYEYENLEEVESWIEEHDEELQCIVSNIIDHPRRVDFGESQRPTLLDYADAIDTMKFLM